MQKKRMMALLCATAMGLSAMLSGCGQETQGQGSIESTSKTSSEVKESTQVSSSSEVEELEEATIQIWLCDVGKQKDSDEVWEAFNEMLQEYVPNTTVEFTVLPNAEYKEKFSQMLAAGEPVDLAWEASWVTGLSQSDLAKDGNIIALDDLLTEYGQGIIDALGKEVIDFHRDPADGKLYYMVSWQGLLTGKHAFQVPAELAALAGDTWVEDTQAVVTKWYNEPWTAENHQAVFDQFDKYFAACKDADKLYSGFDPEFCFAGWNYDIGLTTMAPYNQSVGIKRHDNTFTVVDAIQTEEFALVAKNLADYYKKGYLRSDIASWDQNSLTTVTNGEYTPNTVILRCHNALIQGEKDSIEKGYGIDVEFIDVENEGYLKAGIATSMVIPYCSDEPERAMMVLNAIYAEPELYQLLVYGIEGKHYTDNGDGTITTPYGSAPTADADYGLNKWRIGTCMNALPTQNDNPNYYKELLEGEKTALINPFAGFAFKTDAVADIIVALKAVDEEYGVMLKNGYLGDAWEDNLNKWIAERKAAGVDKLVEEYQKQLNAYIEANNITSW